MITKPRLASLPSITTPGATAFLADSAARHRQSLTEPIFTPRVFQTIFSAPGQTELREKIRLESSANRPHPKALKTFLQFQKPQALPTPTPAFSINFAEHDALKLGLDLYLPKIKCANPPPVAVIVHGSAFTFGDRNCTHVHILAQGLTDRGIAVIALDYRKIPQTHKLTDPKSWRRWFNGNMRYCVQDACQAIDWTHQNASYFGMEQRKIVLLGISAGGNIASVAAAHRSKLIAGLASYYGIYDLSLFTGPLAAVTWFCAYGTSFTGEERTLYNPAVQLYPGPTLLVHGDNDDFVFVDQTYRMALARIKMNLETYLHIEEGMGHGFMNMPPHQSKVTERHLDYIQSFIQALPFAA